MDGWHGDVVVRAEDGKCIASIAAADGTRWTCEQEARSDGFAYRFACIGEGRRSFTVGPFPSPLTEAPLRQVLEDGRSALRPEERRLLFETWILVCFFAYISFVLVTYHFGRLGYRPSGRTVQLILCFAVYLGFWISLPTWFARLKHHRMRRDLGCSRADLVFFLLIIAVATVAVLTTGELLLAFFGLTVGNP
jgi:hypothetical protein